MKKIRALRQFSHFHAGNFVQGDVRTVSDSTAEALIGMKLAEEVKQEAKAEPKQEEKPAKRQAKKADEE